MKLFLLIIVTIISTPSIGQKNYKTNNAKINFFSHTPIEDIEAKSEKVAAVIDPVNNQLAFSLLNTSFQFSNSLMQEHFNEKYMESEKYPKSTFSGKINEPIRWENDGQYKATVTGKLQIHGVTKERVLPVTFVIKNGKITGTSEFIVKPNEHNIEIPKLVWEKIAEEIKVNVVSEFMAQ